MFQKRSIFLCFLIKKKWKIISMAKMAGLSLLKEIKEFEIVVFEYFDFI